MVELLPKLIDDRYYIPLRTGNNICQYRCRTEKFKKSSYPSAISLWNSLDIDIRNSTSLVNLKHKVNKLYRPLCYNKWLNFSLTRRTSVLHTRLRLGFRALNDYLYKINCCNSPLCICGLERETVKHYFILCPLSAAQRNTLLTSAAQVCGQAWLARSDNVKLDYMLKGSNQLSYDENCSLFGFVQQFVLDTCRFC